MTEAQESTLATLCERYHVAYDPDHYHPTFDLPSSWVAGWIGGPDQAGSFNDKGERLYGGTIYVGVSPEGAASS